jgi:hypothetical protein
MFIPTLALSGRVHRRVIQSNTQTPLRTQGSSSECTEGPSEEVGVAMDGEWWFPVAVIAIPPKTTSLFLP